MSSRLRFIFCLASCTLALALVLILQITQNLRPCPLCILQRVGLLFAAFWFLAGSLHRSQHSLSNPQSPWIRFYWVCAILGLLFGGFIAIRQIWLQHLPPDLISSTCTPSLFYAAKYLPFATFWHILFDGSGSCSTISWTFLGFSLAEYSALWFTLMLIFSFIFLFKKVSES